MTKRSRTRTNRELTRDEVYVPPLHQLPEPWERDNALFGYRLIKRSGWAGRLYVLLWIAALLAGLLGASEFQDVISIAMGTALFIAMMMAWKRVWRR